MSHERHRKRQQRFYDDREHGHLRARADDYYASNIVRHLVAAAGIGPEHRVLEIGAGYGRFTFPLLDACGSLVALDLSARMLANLEITRADRNIPVSKCRVHHGDVDAFSDAEPFDFVVGVFVLHHLPDYAFTLRRLADALAPGGGIAFVEPNRRNPSFLVQLLVCQDMTWAEEKGMFELSRAGVEAAYRDARFEGIETTSFGFFPPQILNPFPAARVIERRLEGMRLLQGGLPFWLLTARAPGGIG